MKKLMRRLSKISDSSEYNKLAAESDPSGKRHSGVPEGHVPVYVGEEMERFVVRTDLLNHPIFVELLKRSAAEYGYGQRGGLRIPCRVNVFERVLETLRVGHGRGGGMEELIGSICDEL